MKHLFQEICNKTALSLVFTGGVWQAGGVLEKTGGGGGGGRRGGYWRRQAEEDDHPCCTLEVQSDLVIHWLFRALTA